MSHQFIYFVGLVTCLTGSLAVLGLIAWQGIECWIKFNALRGPLMRFYAEELRKRRDGGEQ